MFAKNSLLARLAVSAACVAFASSWARRLRSVMSRMFALNYVPSSFPIDIAYELDRDVPAVFVLQWKILITDLAEPLQRRHRPLRHFGILEDAHLPKLLSIKLFPGIAQQIGQERIGVQNLGGHGIQDHDAVVRRLKQASVANF